jgi:hypothetical protein
MWESWGRTITDAFRQENMLRDGEEIRFDTSKIEALQANKKEIASIAVSAFKDGLLTDKEAREYLFQVLPVNATNTTTKELQETTIETATKAQTIKLSNADALYRASRKEADDAEEMLVDDLVSMLPTLEKYFDSLLKEKKLMNDDDLTNLFLKSTAKTRAYVIRRFIAQAWKDSESSEDLGDEETNIFASAMVESASRIKEGADNFITEIRGILASNAGRSLDELSELLRAKFTDLKEYRLQRIARTSVTATQADAQKKVWAKYNERTTDPNKKIVRVWLSSRSENARASHSVLDGTAENENGLWNVSGTMASRPCDPVLSAGETVNCGCTTIPVKRNKL